MTMQLGALHMTMQLGSPLMNMQLGAPLMNMQLGAIHMNMQLARPTCCCPPCLCRKVWHGSLASTWATIHGFIALL